MRFETARQIVFPLLHRSRLVLRVRNARPLLAMLRPAQTALLLTLLCGLLSLVWAVPPAPVSDAARQEAREYELKAVYLYNFLQFVQWPEAKSPASRGGVMVIGVVGASPFGEALDDLEKTVRRNGMQPVRFVYFDSADDLQDDPELPNCNLLFFAVSEKPRFSDAVRGLGDAAVLTVADSDGFLTAGGMINLVRSGGKIRWMINRAAVERTGLRMSAQLLGMAIKVYNGN